MKKRRENDKISNTTDLQNYNNTIILRQSGLIIAAVAKSPDSTSVQIFDFIQNDIL